MFEFLKRKYERMWSGDQKGWINQKVLENEHGKLSG